MPRRQIVLAVDVGSTKAAALVAEARPDADLSVLGISATPIMGVRRGLVVDAERAAQSVRDAVNRAVSMAGVEPVDVVASVNGDHLQGMESRAAVEVRGRSVHESDLDALTARLVRASQATGQEVVRLIRGAYQLDGLMSRGSPVGLSVQELSVDALVVTAQVQVLRNLRRTLQMAGMSHIHWVPAGLAASLAALSEDEQQLGVVLLDVGGGTTQVVVWRQGVPRHLAVIPVGGELVTSDLAQGLGIVAAQAERLKVERARLGEDGNGMVELKSVNGQAVKLVQETEIGEIVAARMDEWMGLVERRLAEISWSKGPPGGVVMVGGSSLLRGLSHRIERAWGWPVRLGAPTGLAGLSDLAKSPGYAVVVGLARVGLQDGLGFGRETLWSRLTQAWFRTWG